MTGSVVPDDHEHLVLMFLLELQEEGVCRFRIEAIDAGEMETLSRNWSNGGEEITILK